MEEDLREAACMGNLLAVQKLLKSGVSINSQNSVNGWTALHWASKRGHTAIVLHLLQSGADATIETFTGEYPLQLASSGDVLELLSSRTPDTSVSASAPKESKQLPIVANYLQNPVFPYYDVEVDKYSVAASADSTSPPREHCQGNGLSNTSVESSSQPSTVQYDHTPGKSSSEITVKVRISAESEDFIEVEVSSLTYESLLSAICEELELAPSSVTKIRKLPNVLIRKDKDVQRLKDGQELEVFC